MKYYSLHLELENSVWMSNLKWKPCFLSSKMIKLFANMNSSTTKLQRREPKRAKASSSIVYND